MKTNIFTASLFLAALSLTQVSYATHIQNKEVKRIYPIGDRVYFRLKNDNCIAGSQYYFFRINDTDDTGKYASRNWYSMLLAAATSGKYVSIKIESCVPEGHIEVKYIFQDF